MQHLVLASIIHNA